MIHLAPGDPARLLLPEEATPEDVQLVRKELGLDRPLPIQYMVWLKHAIKLDFGKSIKAQQSASAIYFDRLPATIDLAISALVIAIFFAIPMGIISAIKRNPFLDFSFSFLSLFGIAVPKFWLGILFIFLFSIQLEWLPPFGRGPALFSSILSLFKGDAQPLIESIEYLTLPSITLSLWSWAVFMRYTRTSVDEEIRKLYVKTARVKGLTEFSVMYRHVLRNALVPIVTIIGVRFSALMGGAIVIESVFAWPGVGRLLLLALWDRDYPLIQVSLLMIGVFIVSIFVVLDILYCIIDPRIRITK